MSQTIITSRLREPYVAVACDHCKAGLEYLPPPKSTSNYFIQCSQCSKTFLPPGSSNPNTNSTKPNNPTTKKSNSRRIGTDERPLETEFYEVLGINHQANSSEIKSAYRRLALKMHPDKNPDDPTAEDKFKTLARAYNTLSDPTLRKKYNEFGKQQDIEEGFVDPEAVFSTLFGGERFQDIIGTISLGQEMKTALQKESEDEEIEGSGESQLVSKSNPTTSPDKQPVSKTTKPTLTPEQKAKKAELAQKESAERARVRELRVSHLAEVLTKKLYLYTEQADKEVDEQIVNSVKMIWTIEKEMLADESFGPELLRTVGQVYNAKAKRYLSATTSGGWGGVGLVGGWIHSAKSTAHVFSETVGAVRAAYDVKAVFDEISKAEAEGGPGITEERKKELEEEAARKGLRALFKGAKLEVESVIREVCDRILEDSNLSREQARKRAVALEILGSVYETAQNKNGEDPLGLESGYVKVDKKKPTATTNTTTTPKAS